MPRKDGRLTPQERVFSRAVAETQSPQFAAHKAGYRGVSAPANVMARPAVQAEIARIQTERLFSEALPLAVNAVVSILQSETAPAGSRVQAAKLVFDRTLGTDEAGKRKEPHEMSPEELAAAIAELKRLAADRAKPMLEAEAIEEEPEEDVFG